jgi:hypothetical protein
LLIAASSAHAALHLQEELRGGSCCEDFGGSVAVSGSGETLLVGAPDFERGRGAVWIYRWSGQRWKRAGRVIGGAQEYLGANVAASSEGNVAMASSSPIDEHPSVWLFVNEKGDKWVGQQIKVPEEIVGAGPDFRGGIALSADGSTALVSGHLSPTEGAVWAFTRSGTRWTQLGQVLTVGSDHGGEPQDFGWSGALSGDGGVALISDHGSVCPEPSPNCRLVSGSAWTFRWTGATWTQVGSPVTASREFEQVALTTTGEGALLSEPSWPGEGESHGLVRALSRTDAEAGWETPGQELLGPGEPREELGSGISLAGEGDTALIKSERTPNHPKGVIEVYQDDPVSGWGQLEALELPEGFKTSEHTTLAMSDDGSAAVVGVPEATADPKFRPHGYALVYSTAAAAN